MSNSFKSKFFEKLLKKGFLIESAIPSTDSRMIHESYRENPFVSNEDSAIPYKYLRSEHFLNTIEKMPMYIPSLLPSYFSKKEIWSLLHLNPYIALSINSEDLTNSMYVYAVFKDVGMFAILDESYQTIQIVKYVVEKEPLLLQYVREDLLLYFICLKAVKANWEAIHYVPTSLIDQQIVDIANAAENSFLINVVPEKFLTEEIYKENMLLNPQLFVDTFIRDHLSVVGVDSFIQALENAFNVEEVIARADPLLLLESNPTREAALFSLIKKRPSWIHYFKPCTISLLMLEAAVTANEFPLLNELMWTSEYVGQAFKANPKSLTVIPKSGCIGLGEEREFAAIQSAISGGWFNEIPHYFFSEGIINNEDYESILIEHREAFSYIFNHKEQPNWERLLEFRSSVAELSLLKASVPSEFAQTIFEHGVEHYVVLQDTDKTIDRTIAFLKDYPECFDLVPDSIKGNSKSLSMILIAVPYLMNNMPADEALGSLLGIEEEEF